MASTFRRHKAPSGAADSSSLIGLKGTKPWTGGITLTSTGLRDLDQLLGGGQPLGTCIWLEEDRWTGNLALCLIRYWCAEALSQEQDLLIPANREDDTIDLSVPSSWEDDEAVNQVDSYSTCSVTDIQRLLRSLPRNLHKDKQTVKVALLSADDTGLVTLQEGIEEEQEEEGHNSNNKDADGELINAWQYRSSVQRERLGHSSPGPRSTKSSSSEVYCHSYDLHGRLHYQMDVGQGVHIPVIPCSNESSSQQGGFEFYRKLLQRILGLLSETPRKVVRLLLYHPDPSILQVVLPLLLTYVRTHRLPVIFMIAVQTWTVPEQNCLSLLRRASDVVLTTEGFASRREYPPPPEFRMFHGLLHVHKVSTVTAATAHGGGHFADVTTSKRPTANLYGIKRDRRKLHIELLHIPPEDYAEGGGSVVGGGVRSGAGRTDRASKSGGLGCASSGGGGSLLDF